MTDWLAAARDLLHRFPLVDGHNDLPWAIREQFGSDPVRARLSGPVGATQTDLSTVYRPGRRLGLPGAVFAERLARGWTKTDCAALAGGNLPRVLRDAGNDADKDSSLAG